MYSYAIVVGISIVVSLGYSEAYVNCYQCASSNSPSSNTKDCEGPDLSNVRTCVGETCTFYTATCSGTPEECEDIRFRKNATASVSRTCMNETIVEDNCAILTTTMYSQTTCLCKGDLCNAGPIVKAFPEITLVFLIMSSYAVTVL